MFYAVFSDSIFFMVKKTNKVMIYENNSSSFNKRKNTSTSPYIKIVIFNNELL